MAIRDWSFTKFWAISVFFWFCATTLLGIADYWSRELLGLPAVLVGLTPAFLAGAWAGSHPEIAYWPRVRLVSMWVMVLGVIAMLSDPLSSWRLPLVMIGAPAVIFTLRWYEVSPIAPRIGYRDPTIPPDTPPNGSLLS